MEAIIQKTSGNWLTKAELGKKGMVKIAVNAFNNLDSDQDISRPGSFSKTLKENFDRVRWFLNHNVTQLLGVPVKGYETEKFLIMIARFNLSKEIGRDTYEDYKLYLSEGKTLEHSIGVQPVKFEVDQESGIRTVTEWKLWEFSTLTHWGANESTPLIGIKGRQRAEQMLDNPNYSDSRKYDLEALLTKPSRDTSETKAALTRFINLLNV
jgi:HK97 family phage prohead protease